MLSYLIQAGHFANQLAIANDFDQKVGVDRWFVDADGFARIGQRLHLFVFRFADQFAEDRIANHFVVLIVTADLLDTGRGCFDCQFG